MELQDYSKRESIEGVKLIDLPHFYDDGGSFMEIGRLFPDRKLKYDGITKNEPLVIDIGDTLRDCQEVQINYSMLMPGTTKGFHIHKKQTDVWFIPPFQRMLIGLIDLRSEQAKSWEIFDGFAKSGYKPPIMRFVMGIKPQLLVIPPMVAHLIKNIDTKPGHMIYLVDQFFNPQDEFRLPWDILGKDFVEVEKG